MELNPSGSSEPRKVDVLIIGGGPTGSSAAIYTARADLETVVLDKGLTAGALGMTNKIVNYPGVPGPISGPDLIRRMREQAESFGAEFITDKVLNVDLESDPKTIWAGEGTYEAKAVIVATGAMGRKNTVPGEESLLGRGVSYCATCDAAFFREQEVAVAGNNDEAVEEALVLTRFASHVHFLSHTKDLNVSNGLAAELTNKDNVTVHLATRLREIVGEDEVEAVRISTDGEERTLTVSGAFVYLQGTAPVTDFLNDQLPTRENGCLIVDDVLQTEIPGVFAAGDVLCKHLKQAALAAADGVMAAMAVDRFVSGRDQLKPDWSK